VCGKLSLKSVDVFVGDILGTPLIVVLSKQLYALATSGGTAINRFVVTTCDGHMGAEYWHSKVFAPLMKNLLDALVLCVRLLLVKIVIIAVSGEDFVRLQVK